MRRGKMGFWYRFAVCVLKPVLLVTTRRDWRGRENIPRSGGVIVAVNHISYADPFIVAHYLYDSRRLPRFLAKIEVFRARFAGRVVRGAKQIPVYRYTQDAADALGPAIEAVRAGECLVIYPEGTVTKDPDYWPMRAKTGVARVALATGAPVIPVAQWGAQQIYGRDKKAHLLPRHAVALLAGPAVDLSAYRDREPSIEVLREVTDLVMSRIRHQVGELRGETPPERVFDPRRDLPAAASRERKSA